MQLRNSSECDYDAIHFRTGVLYATYNWLKSKRTARSKGTYDFNTRVEQVVAWCGGADFEGVLAFDEVHKAKNVAAPTGFEPAGRSPRDTRNRPYLGAPRVYSSTRSRARSPPRRERPCSRSRR